MRVRNLRSKIYEPQRKAGVILEDWPFVILLALLFFALGFLGNMLFRVRLPLPLLGLFGGTALGIAFFNWTRRGKRRGFLQHLIADYVTGGCERRGYLPSDLGPPGAARADFIIPGAARRR